MPPFRAKTTCGAFCWVRKSLHFQKELLAIIVPLKLSSPMDLTARLAVLLLLTALLASCARQPYPSVSANTKSDDTTAEPKLPFSQVPGRSGISPTSSLVPAARNVPAGTPLTIRLRSTVSSSTSHPGDSFRAVLDEPVLLQGKSILPMGTAVTGEVVDLNRSATTKVPAYLRLRLTSISRNGKLIPVESSSIFAKAGLPQNGGGRNVSTGIAAAPLTSPDMLPARGKKVEFAVDRRLTFRLTAPLMVPR